MRYHDAMFHTLMRILLLSSLMMFLSATSAQADSAPLVMPTCNISQSQWESPDRSRTLLADPALRRLLQAWSAQPSAHLSIEYPGGEQGVIWANRLVGWLVAYGVPGRAISLFPGSSNMNTLALSLKTSGGGT